MKAVIASAPADITLITRHVSRPEWMSYITSLMKVRMGALCSKQNARGTTTVAAAERAYSRPLERR